MLGCLPRFDITASNQRSQPKTNDVSKGFIQKSSVNGSRLLKRSEQSLRSKIYVFHSNPIQKTTPDHTMRPKNSGSTVPESKVAPTHIPVLANHRWIHQGLTDCPPSIYQNLIPRFLSFLSCFSPLISILFAYPVAVAYPVPVPVPYPVPVPVPIGKPLLPGMGYGAEAGVVGVAALEAGTVTVTVTCAVAVTVTGAGQLAPDSGRPLGLIAGRLEGRAEEAA